MAKNNLEEQRLNVFIVFSSAELGTRVGFCRSAQAEAGSLTRTHTPDIEGKR